MLKALVDSIDGDMARVLIGDEGVAVAVSVRQLPVGTRVGMVLRVKFTIEQGSAVPARSATRQENER